jgi:PAS domain S-box-containing protein
VNDQINTIYKDSDGILWIGSRDGLNIYDYSNKTFTILKHQSNNPHSLSNNWINVIFEDHNKNIWLGTEGGGINKYDKSTRRFQNYIHIEDSPNSLTDNRVRAILEDHKGILWIGTMKGLSKFNFNTNEFTQYYHDPNKTNSISSDIILTIYEDKLKQIWVGTADGLSKYDSSANGFINYTTKNGLPNNVIYGVLEDTKGNFWISTNHGISKFNQETETFKNHDSYDGLPSNEFNYGAFLKLTTGEMLFGGTNGFTIFHPDSINYNNYKPPVLITDLKLFNKSVQAGEKFNDRLILSNTIYESDEIELTYKDYILTFEFAAFNYISPENNQYAYILEGLEEEWNYVGNRRFATYSTLPPGNYTFKVKASNNDGVWNNNSTSINIRITPPYWATWQFRIALIIMVLILVYLFFRIRIRAIKLQNRNLESKVKLRTKNLYEVNTQLEENQVELEVKQEEIKVQRDAIELQNLELRKLTIVARETHNAIAIIAPNGIIEWINEGFTRLYGYTKTELDEGGIKSLMDFSINKDINKIIDYCRQTQKSKIYETLNKTKNGNHIWIQTTITPIIGENGETIKFIAIDSYISKRKKAEEEIKQKNEEILAQRDELEDHRKNLEKLVDERTHELKISKEKAEESDRLKTSFLTNMSHEIRTPMNAIVGFSTMLRDEHINSNERNTLISEITTHTYSLLYLIDNILEIARLDTNQFIIKKERFFPNEILRTLFDSFEELIELNKVQFELKIPIKEIEIFSDKYRISQIFKNLIDNAIKFTENGKIEIGYTIERNKIEFFVIDSGIGLSTDQQDHIFDRFTKIEDNKKKLYRGAGLGLAICKNIINLLNGSIWVESNPGKGAAFYFTVPYNTEAEITDTNSQINIPNKFSFDWSSKTVLIAEDEESNVNYYHMILRKTNINIINAENGKQAIELNKNNKVDLILMDIKMPIMDGLEATKIIKLEQPNIPIISVSAFSSKQDIELSKNAGCDNHISKPLQKAEMLNIINKYLETI